MAKPAAERRKAADSYFELVRRFPLRNLRSDGELQEARSLLGELLNRKDRDEGVRDYLDALADFVCKYEAKRFPLERADDAEMLKFLIGQSGLTQSQVAQEVGMAESTISETLAGKRRLNRSHIGKLCGFFKIGVGAFSFPAGK